MQGVIAVTIPVIVALAVGIAFMCWDLKRPIKIILHCPNCHHQHVDAPEPGSTWTNPPHRTHLCHACGNLWKPSHRNTDGVKEL